jgi:hypothetical protein
MSAMQEMRATLAGVEKERKKQKEKKANRSVSKLRQPSWSEQRASAFAKQKTAASHHKNNSFTTLTHIPPFAVASIHQHIGTTSHAQYTINQKQDTHQTTPQTQPLQPPQ